MQHWSAPRHRFAVREHADRDDRDTVGDRGNDEVVDPRWPCAGKAKQPRDRIAVHVGVKHTDRKPAGGKDPATLKAIQSEVLREYYAYTGKTTVVD